MITFKCDKLLEHIRILGESIFLLRILGETKINEYNDKSMLCKKCFKYVHTEKRCSSLSYLYGRCAEPGHQSEGCASEVVKCCSCGENHVSGHSTCPDRKKEETILKIQKDQKVWRAMSRQILETGVNIHTVAKASSTRQKNCVTDAASCLFDAETCLAPAMLVFWVPWVRDCSHRRSVSHQQWSREDVYGALVYLEWTLELI